MSAAPTGSVAGYGSPGRHNRMLSTASALRRALGRLSYGSFNDSTTNVERRLSRNSADETSKSVPPIPSVVPQSGNIESTPLPMLSITVLSIMMLGEFLSASVCTPFLLFMVKGFGTFTTDGDVSFWTGILVATFFLTQFLTSLLWQTVADKYGRRTVLVASLLGGSVFCTTFGTSKTLGQALCLRLMQGVFAGSIGVARGSVSSFTDQSNEGRAYAILGFCWGFGGVSGSMIGGVFESPAIKWPQVFGKVQLLIAYPYLLPCAMAGSIMFTGAVLACFLAPDGGPCISITQETKTVVWQNDGDLHTIHEHEEAPLLPKPSTQAIAIPVPFNERSTNGGLGTTTPRDSRFQSSGIPLDRTNTIMSSKSRRSGFGPSGTAGVPMDRTYTMASAKSGVSRRSAYRPRLARNATTAGAAAAIMARRRSVTSMASSSARPRQSIVGDDSEEINPQTPASSTSRMSFARRLVLANENAVNHIADLWVAAAMFVDQGDAFNDFDADPEDYWGSEDEGELDEDWNEDETNPEASYPPHRSRSQMQSGNGVSPFRASDLSSSSPATSPNPRAMPLPSHRDRQNSFNLSINTNVLDSPSQRRFSSNYPGIYGAGTPTMSEMPRSPLLFRSELESEAENQGLAPIMESTVASHTSPVPKALSNKNSEQIETTDEKTIQEPSMISQIPVMVIMQYGLLALHATTHDQVFMSYLVSNYYAGGLNLNAGHFAQLIALMSFAQIIYQFYLYPHLGPPRGPFSHLTMFRIGSVLFIVGYLSVIFFRKPLATPEGHGTGLLMTALAASMAIRFCGGTFGYTSISILLNYMTPPHAVGYANGIAQSVVSLARCVGPILGGYLWSTSINGNPEGYPFGFIVCAGICVLAIIHSMFIR
ncbi:hypothetical protein K435DRAFT_307650 [Dendrothele bispora CBS 962.96]|uniref:Major facilitator superfamily MFS-1 n=1 Tax=Dendrothele bispora (strain CBS 962.96) TaxID=1314807 RepID=A0A4S8LHR1_DENBC|nr:hypothetical protein K435DRAFT_307650 [Dendrothele bispora CBS 962.96]